MALAPDERRNFRLNTAEGALFIASGALVSPQTVLPALVAGLGGGNVAIGLLGVVVYVGLFLPQIFAARYIETLPWKKPWTVSFGVIHRSLLLLIGLTLIIFGGSYPQVALPLFFLLYTAVQVFMGITTPGWFDLFAKLTPANRRGRLVGWRNSLGGAGAFVCGIILTWLLGVVWFPLNYSLVIVLAAALQFASLSVQSRLVESEPSPTVDRKPIFTYLKDLPGVVRTNREFRKFIVALVCLTLGAMPVGFFTVYALKEFSADQAVVGEFTLSMVSIQVVSALVIGLVADRYGNRIALMCAGGGLVLASASALLAPAVGWFMLVYLFLGINLGTELMARYNMAIEYGPAQYRSMYVGLMNTLVAPFYISGIIGGVLVDWFGYRPVFFIGMVFALAGVVLLLRWVKEPHVAHAGAGT